VNVSRLSKRLSRAITISWRDQPTRYDIEALQANVRRVGLVIRIRWSLIFVLVVYSLVAGAAYATRMPMSELASRMAIPAVALVLVVLYNTYYQLNYRRLANIAVWNNLQLALDAVVVTVLVYFSGGVNSWFWSMYALFIPRTSRSPAGRFTSTPPSWPCGGAGRWRCCLAPQPCAR